MMNTKQLLAAMALLFVPLVSVMAQDDVYFVNKRAKQAKAAAQAQAQEEPRRYVPVQIVYADDDDPVNVGGSKRDVDEYNRRGRSGLQNRLVENPDGTFTYQLPGNDTLYIMEDSMAVTTRSLANDVYAQGYNEGYQDGEDYAYTRRLNRFGYAGGYASPWYYSYYDPFYWDDFYWGYDPYWYGGYYGWHRPYWGYAGWGYGWRGYWGYDPYWYGGYYGWGYPYYGGYYRGGYYGRPHNSRTDVAHTSRYRGQTGRSAGYDRRRGYVGANSSATGRTRSFGSTTRSGIDYTNRSAATTNSTNRVSSFGTSRSNTPTYSTPSTSTRSSSFGGSSSSSRSGGFSGGGFSGGGGATGGSRGGGGGRGR